MERNEELRGDESPRANELREAELRRSDEALTASDSLVHDGSVVSDRELDDVADRTERAGGGDDIVRHHDHPTVGDQVGEAAGGISGVLAGAAIGSLGGPIGTVIGGIAGAIGGWWTGRAISEAASNFTRADDEHYRSSYQRAENRVADRAYEDVRPAYQLGHLASRNPDYQGREFDEIEADLQRGWTDDVSRQSGDWQQVRGYARDAYSRGRSGGQAGVPQGDSEGIRGRDVGTESPAASAGVSSFGSQGAGGLEAGGSASMSPSGDSLEQEFGSFDSTGRQGLGDKGPATTAATDSAGGVRSADYDNVSNRQRAMHADEASERPGFTDPVAGEGVENIASSGLSPRGDTGDEPAATNETERTERMRGEEEGRNQRY